MTHRTLTRTQREAITRFTEWTYVGLKSEVTHRDQYGNPVLRLNDRPTCTHCIAPAPVNCVCGGTGFTDRVRIYTVLPNGQYTSPLGGFANATPLQPDEAMRWLEQEVVG